MENYEEQTNIGKREETGSGATVQGKKLIHCLF